MDDQAENKDVTQTLIQQLIKAVIGFAETLTAFKDTVTSLKDVLLHDQKRYEDFSTKSQKQHETFAEDCQKRHESFVIEKQKQDEDFAAETRQRYENLAYQNRSEDEKQKKRMQRDAYVVTFISVFAICGSLIGTSYWDYQGRLIDLKRVQSTKLYNQENITQGKILYFQRQMEHRFALRDQLMQAMVKMRAVRSIGQLQCKDGQYIGNDKIEYQQKLLMTRYDLMSATYKTVGIFDDTINKDIAQFVAVSDADQGNVCVKDAICESTLIPLQKDIDTKILSAIQVIAVQKDAMLKRLDHEIEENSADQSIEQSPSKIPN